MSDVSEKTLNTIRKLLALAAGGANENEAASAAAKAQSMMAELGIEIQTIEAREGRQANDRGKVEHDRAAMYNYQRTLMAVVAENNFCRHWLIKTHAVSFGKMRKVVRHQLLGRKSNVAGAMMLYDYLIDTMDRLLPYQGMEKRGKEALLWLDGCSARLALRLRERRKEQEAETRRRRDEEAMRARHPGAAPGTAMVILTDVYSTEDDLNNDHEYGWEPGTTTRKRLENEARWKQYREERDAKKKGYMDEGLSEALAELLASGYSHTHAEEILASREKMHAAAKKEETPRQREKRLAKEQRQQEEWARRQRKFDERYYHPAYQAGLQTGAEIGLDDQVQDGTAKERLS